MRSTWPALEELSSRLRPGFRRADRHRWRLASIVIMLALGIAASTAVFAPRLG